MALHGAAALNYYPPYRFRVGNVECTIVSDGPLDLGPAALSFAGTDEGTIVELLRRNFLPPDTVLAEQNVLVADIQGKRVLFETGMGAATLFGNRSGLLVTTLQAAGIPLESIDAIACSHPHPDHIGGLCSLAGEPQFPNARIFLSKADYLFWTDEALLGTRVGAAIQIARANLLPLREKLVFFRDGEEFLPGVRATFTPGHTAEHACFFLTSMGESLALVGDVSHHSVLLLERPGLHFIYDLDPEEAVRSRIKLFTMLAEKRIGVLGYHFPWPGLGHVVSDGDHFRFVPKPTQWTSGEFITSAGA